MRLAADFRSPEKFHSPTTILNLGNCARNLLYKERACEARTIASLNHPHICILHDVGHHDEIDFLVMEYLEGETLAQRLQRGAQPLEKVLQYAIEISDALDKAHRRGITHRDLKPGNIMLSKSGTKLLDFGLAKLAQESAPATPEASDDEERNHRRRNDPGHVAIHGTGASRSQRSGCSHRHLCVRRS